MRPGGQPTPGRSSRRVERQGRRASLGTGRPRAENGGSACSGGPPGLPTLSAARGQRGWWERSVCALGQPDRQGMGAPTGAGPAPAGRLTWRGTGSGRGGLGVVRGVRGPAGFLRLPALRSDGGEPLHLERVGRRAGRVAGKGAGDPSLRPCQPSPWGTRPRQAGLEMLWVTSLYFILLSRGKNWFLVWSPAFQAITSPPVPLGVEPARPRAAACLPPPAEPRWAPPGQRHCPGTCSPPRPALWAPSGPCLMLGSSPNLWTSVSPTVKCREGLPGGRPPGPVSSIL